MNQSVHDENLQSQTDNSPDEGINVSSEFKYEDASWTEAEWRELIEQLIGHGLISWKEVVVSTMGHMNPSQVGTSLASSEGFKRRYGKGNTMSVVMEWFYAEKGRCIDCGSRIELQADHIVPKEIIRETGLRLAREKNLTSAEQQTRFEQAIQSELERTGDQNKVSSAFITELANEAVGILAENLSPNQLRDRLAFVADRLDNMGTRCRRCNVIRRPSHQFGGKTHLTAESALMWILFSFRPRTLRDYIRMCRLYGMTMADIRMQEGWAMAHWLQHADSFHYDLDAPDRACSIVLWPDNAITRAWPTDEIGPTQVLYTDKLPSEDFCFIAAEHIEDDLFTVNAYRMPVEDLPFCHYFKESDQPPQALAITYSAPKRDGEEADGPVIGPLPPRRMFLIAHAVIDRQTEITVTVSSDSRKATRRLSPNSRRLKLLDLDDAPEGLAGTITEDS